MKLTEFKPEHLLEIEMMNTPDGVTEMKHQAVIARGAERAGLNAFTAVHDGIIIGCGGVKALWPGVGEAWGVPSVHVVNYKRDVVMLAKEALRIIWKQSPDLNRVQAVVASGFVKGELLAGYLGFECEGVMRKYGKNGEDFKLFALVR